MWSPERNAARHDNSFVNPERRLSDMDTEACVAYYGNRSPLGTTRRPRGLAGRSSLHALDCRHADAIPREAITSIRKPSSADSASFEKMSPCGDAECGVDKSNYTNETSMGLSSRYVRLPPLLIFPRNTKSVFGFVASFESSASSFFFSLPSFEPSFFLPMT